MFKKIKNSNMYSILILVALLVFCCIFGSRNQLYTEGLTGLTDYIYHSEEASPINAELWGEVIKDTDFPGYDLGGTPGSLSSCKKQCQDNPACVEIVSGKAYGRDNNCFMKCITNQGRPVNRPGLNTYRMKDTTKRAVSPNSEKTCNP